MPLREYVCEQRQRCGEHHRRTDAHHGPRSDQLVRRLHQPADKARDAEDGETGEKHSLAPEPVRKAAEDQYGRREQQVERVDDPLQLSGRGVQLARERRQRDVDDRRVQVDHERRQQQRDQD